MSVLLDTNILLRSAEPTHPHHKLAEQSMVALRKQGEVLCVVPQVLYEYWVASTRPLDQNGLGFTSSIAEAELDKFEMLFALLDDTDLLYTNWRRLVLHHDVKGKPAHDARLVAAMMVHRIEKLLTFNDSDFNRFPGITVLTPQAVLNS